MTPDPWTETADNGDGTVRIIGWHEATGLFEAVLDESQLLAALAVVREADRRGLERTRALGYDAFTGALIEPPC